ncbi:MAG: phosphotransferase [Pseudomonadota bacterium]
MTETVEKALALWDLQGATWDLIAARENHVYRVERGDVRCALRLHRRGYRTDVELRSELAWMQAATARGLGVPRPITSATDQLLHLVDGVQVSVLSWISGKPLGQTGVPLDIANRCDLFRTIGSEMARLHDVADSWTPPPEFERCRWDRAGLLGDTPLWGRFWDSPALSDKDRALFRGLRSALDAELAKYEADLDFGLIHADLVRENIMIDGAEVRMIDFDDFGYGFRLFDIATFLFKNRAEPDYEALQKACLDGYRAMRDIDLSALDVFVLLRALTYVGWIVPRMHEPGAQTRNARYVQIARALAARYQGASAA